MVRTRTSFYVQAIRTSFTYPTNISCPSPQECEVVGLSTEHSSRATFLYRTVDGGIAWNKVDTTTSQIPVTTLDCPSTSECVAAGGTAIFGTWDGGTTWTMEHPPLGGLDFNSLSCPSPTVCVAGSDGGLPSEYSNEFAASVTRTSNGGTSWSTEDLPTGPSWIRELTCPTALVCVAETTKLRETEGRTEGPSCNSTLLRTTDGGHTWSSITAVTACGGLSCPSALVCEVVGSQATRTRSELERTIDGGATFTGQLSDPGETYGGLFCLTILVCLASTGPVDGSSAKTVEYETTNSGNAWERHVPVVIEPHCVSPRVCTALSADGGWFRSSNLGAEWSKEALPRGIRQLETVTCPSRSDCHAIGSRGTRPLGPKIALVSTNGGGSWKQTELPQGVQVNGLLTCPTPSTCFATGTLLGNRVILRYSERGHPAAS